MDSEEKVIRIPIKKLAKIEGDGRGAPCTVKGIIPTFSFIKRPQQAQWIGAVTSCALVPSTCEASGKFYLHFYFVRSVFITVTLSLSECFLTVLLVA